MFESASKIEFRFVQIVDPVSGHQYFLDTVNTIAHRITVPPAAASGIRASVPSMMDLSRGTLHRETLARSRPGWPAPQTETTELGSRSIDGAATQGLRTTMTFPAGFMGSDRPVVVTTEAWVSEERKIVVMSTRDGPMKSSWVTKTSNYRSVDPDPELFQIPPGYVVMDEAGPFRVDIAMPVASR
jgi:hypothetical protein